MVAYKKYEICVSAVVVVFRDVLSASSSASCDDTVFWFYTSLERFIFPRLTLTELPGICFYFQ